MVDVETGLRLVAAVLLILVNAFFVAVEFALTRVRQYPREEFQEPGLQRAWEMTEELEIYLTSCQIWISGSSIALGIVAEPALTHLLEPAFQTTPLAGVGAGAALGFVLINLVHLTHGEQTPTYLGVERSKQVVRHGATPLYLSTLVVKPFIILGDTVAKWTLKLFGVEMTGSWLDTGTDVIETRAELRNQLDALLTRSEITEERREEILNALTIDERPVEEIMTDRDEIVFLTTEAPESENLERATDSRFTRYPLVGERPEDFLGTVYAPSIVGRYRELVTGQTTFEELATAPMTMEARTPISRAIDRFQSAHQELALVLEEGAVVGLVTATDALEAVVGQIEDPLDREQTE